MLSLLDMPDIPMKLILKYCDFPAILNLRKTCHDLRSYIKTVKPCQKAWRMYIINIGTSVTIVILFDGSADNRHTLYPQGMMINLTYKKKKNGCEIEWWQMRGERKEIKRKFLKKSDNLEIFVRDLQVIMDTEVVCQLEISTNTSLPRAFKAVMEGQAPLRVNRIHFSSVRQRQIMEILPYFSSNHLEYINIRPCDDDRKGFMTIDTLPKCEQWKSVKHIGLSPGPFVIPIESFTHLERGSVGYQMVTVEILQVLKKAFFTSTLPSKHFSLTFFDWPPSSRNSIFDYLGVPLEVDEPRRIWWRDEVEDDVWKRWIYRKPNNPEQVLVIQFQTLENDIKGHMTFNFDLVDIKDVPEMELAQIPPMELVEVDDVEMEIPEASSGTGHPEMPNHSQDEIRIEDEAVERTSCFRIFSNFFSTRFMDNSIGVFQF